MHMHMRPILSYPTQFSQSPSEIATVISILYGRIIEWMYGVQRVQFAQELLNADAVAKSANDDASESYAGCAIKAVHQLNHSKYWT